MPNNDFVPKIWSKYKKCVYYTKIYFLYCYWYNIIILRCSEYHCVIVIVLFYLRQFILPSTGCEDIHTANNVKTAGVNVARWRRWLMLPSEQRRRMERSWWMRWGANRGQTGWWWERMNQQLKEHQSYSPTISDPVYAKQRKQNKTEKSARLWMKENFVANIDVGEAVLIFFFPLGGGQDVMIKPGVYSKGFFVFSPKAAEMKPRLERRCLSPQSGVKCLTCGGKTL